jgi:hypothetical protein
MAFDFGFDFRGTSGYVTDPSYASVVLGENYPNTYTNGAGKSINAGFTVAGQVNPLDRDNTQDPRIAGTNYEANDGYNNFFQVDLSSGSAPGAGTYSVDLAMGAFISAGKQCFKLLDTTTLLIDGTFGGAGQDTSAGHFIDATLTDVTGGATWTGTPVTKTFATTLAKLSIGTLALSGSTFPAHFRLTLQAAGAAAFPPRMLMLLGVGS